MLYIIGYFDGSVKNDKAIGVWTYSLYEKLNKQSPRTKIKTERGWDYSLYANSIQAEFIGLIGLLDKLKQYFKIGFVDFLLINGDCESIINQIKYKKSNDNEILKDYLLLAKELVSMCQISIDLQWIPRSKNKSADKLCKMVWQDLKNKMRNTKNVFGSNQPENILEFI